MKIYWEKRGQILKPQINVPWLKTNAGPCFARIDPQDNNLAQLYVSGRDECGRSHIGRVVFDFQSEKVIDIAEEPLLPLGEKGAFDENGISYPYIVEHNGHDYLYYTGWIQGVQVRWYNDLGLAISNDRQNYKRISRAPLQMRNNSDFIGIGSTAVIKHEKEWLMWFTRFDRWGSSVGEHEHYYNIKHAVSLNGVDWVVKSQACIDFNGPDEYAIAKPCVIHTRKGFFMWYSYRGSSYHPGLAHSLNGEKWVRLDNAVGIEPSATGWDSEMLCYPFVLEREGELFMFYNGNGYGATGLGLARSDLKSVLENSNV